MARQRTRMVNKKTAGPVNPIGAVTGCQLDRRHDSFRPIAQSQHSFPVAARISYSTTEKLFLAKLFPIERWRANVSTAQSQKFNNWCFSVAFWCQMSPRFKKQREKSYSPRVSDRHPRNRAIAKKGPQENIDHVPNPSHNDPPNPTAAAPRVITPAKSGDPTSET